MGMKFLSKCLSGSFLLLQMCLFQSVHGEEPRYQDDCVKNPKTEIFNSRLDGKSSVSLLRNDRELQCIWKMLPNARFSPFSFLTTGENAHFLSFYLSLKKDIHPTKTFIFYSRDFPLSNSWRYHVGTTLWVWKDKARYVLDNHLFAGPLSQKEWSVQVTSQKFKNDYERSHCSWKETRDCSFLRKILTWIKVKSERASFCKVIHEYSELPESIRMRQNVRAGEGSGEICYLLEVPMYYNELNELLELLERDRGVKKDSFNSHDIKEIQQIKKRFYPSVL
jgi:hypothetical protein